MGIKRVIDIEFWKDEKLIEYTPEDRYFFMYLLTNPHTTQLGIYKFSKKIMAFELGYDQSAIEVLLRRFQDQYGLIQVSFETSEIGILNYLRHSIIKGGKPVEDLLKKEMKKVKNKDLILEIFKHLSKFEDINQTVETIVKRYLEENDNENQNDNENDNEVSYHDSSNDSLEFPQINYLDEDEKENVPETKPNKMIEDSKQVVNFWCSKNITQSRYTEKIKSAYNGLIKDKYTHEEILKSIENYATIYHSNQYYYSHAFPLLNFLKQQNGSRTFMDENKPLENYKINNTSQFKKPSSIVTESQINQQFMNNLPY